MEAWYQKLLTFFIRGLSEHDLNLLPIYSEKGHGGHFTLLVLDFSASACVGLRLVAQLQVAGRTWSEHHASERTGFLRYYDTMNEIKPGCFGAMVRLVSVVLQVAPQELKKAERRNVARQNGAECLFWACWYLEDEIRHFLGQGWASQGWPWRGLVMGDKAPRAGEAASVRFRLLRASEVLGKAHERWQQEFAEKIEEREAVDKRAFERAQAAEERRIH